jgi:hypothetical protein
LQIAYLKQQNAELQDKINNLGRNNVNLKADLSRMNDLYTQAKALLEANNVRLERLLIDSSNHAKDIDTLKSQNSYLTDLTSKMKETLSSFNPVRISFCVFRSPGCISKRDGSYILSCMKKLELRFILVYNDMKSLKRDETVLVVFTFPQIGVAARQIKKEVHVKVGQETTVTLDEKEGYKFTPGLYTAQIIHEQFSKTKPLQMHSLTAKHRF